ncbi:hypothetical protein ACFQZ4_24200 [Catellatospora coxensis]
MTYPAVALGYRLEVAPSADPAADPGTWSWTDITNDLAIGVPITHKRGTEDEQGDTSSESAFTFRNPARRWSTDNPLSDMWPGWKVDCPIRCSLSLDGGGSWSELFTQFASEITDTWGGTSGRLPRTAVRADGIFRRLGRGDSERSAMYRTMAGYATGDIAPWAYWPMEDGADATRFAAATPGFRRWCSAATSPSPPGTPSSGRGRCLCGRPGRTRAAPYRLTRPRARGPCRQWWCHPRISSPRIRLSRCSGQRCGVARTAAFPWPSRPESSWHW